MVENRQQADEAATSATNDASPVRAQPYVDVRRPQAILEPHTPEAEIVVRAAAVDRLFRSGLRWRGEAGVKAAYRDGLAWLPTAWLLWAVKRAVDESGGWTPSVPEVEAYALTAAVEAVRYGRDVGRYQGRAGCDRATAMRATVRRPVFAVAAGASRLAASQRIECYPRGPNALFDAERERTRAETAAHQPDPADLVPLPSVLPEGSHGDF